MTQKELIKLFFENNYIIRPEILQAIPQSEDPIIIQTAKSNLLRQEQATILTEEIIKKALNIKEKDTSSVKVAFSYNKVPEKREVQDFVRYFRSRYETLRNILCTRQELQSTISISRALEKKEPENVAIIGVVIDKNETKNGNIILTLEDITGTIKVLISNKREEILKKTEDIVYDEVLGITGTTGDKIIFARDVIFPDIPLTKEIKKSPDETYAAFISDIHVGSNLFLPKEFRRFIDWVNGETGTEEQREAAKKLKYLFIAGDLVDGVGIYPEQEKELIIKDIYEQYNKCAEYLSMIRPDVNIIICGGNHDALRISEPQPKLHEEYAKAIYKLQNVTVVSNPALINIHSSEKFPGFDILIYHGYSFDYYVANVNSIRNNGAYDRADLIMKFLLQKRHIAPSHSSTLYIPDKEKDPLVIEKIPDFFISGHIHKANINSYRGVSTICGSCWQAKTLFQEKVGHNPEPARVPIVNLKTREMIMLRFDS